MPLRASMSQLPVQSRLLIFVGFVLIGAFSFTIIGMFLSKMFWGINLMNPDSLSDLNDPKVLSTLKLLQTLSSIGMFVLPPLVLAYLCNINLLQGLQLDKKPSPRSVMLLITVGLGALPLINLMDDWNSKMVLPAFLQGIEHWMRESEDKAAALTKAFLTMDTFGQFAFNMLMVAIIPALGEELVFRGVLQRLFGEWFKNKHVAVILSAFIFSAIHLQFYGFVPRMLLGIMFGYMLVWSGSLWLPIIGHFVNNGSAVLLTYLSKLGLVAFDADKIGTPETGIRPALASLFLVSLLLYLIFWNEQKRNTDE